MISVDESGVFPNVKEGEVLVCRVMTDEGIAIFSVNILYMTDVPIFTVYIDCPTQIKFMRIRAAGRVTSSLPVLVLNNTTSGQSGITGKRSDVSDVGAGLILEA